MYNMVIKFNKFLNKENTQKTEIIDGQLEVFKKTLTQRLKSTNLFWNLESTLDLINREELNYSRRNDKLLIDLIENDQIVLLPKEVISIEVIENIYLNFVKKYNFLTNIPGSSIFEKYYKSKKKDFVFLVEKLASITKKEFSINFINVFLKNLHNNLIWTNYKTEINSFTFDKISPEELLTEIISNENIDFLSPVDIYRLRKGLLYGVHIDQYNIKNIEIDCSNLDLLKILSCKPGHWKCNIRNKNNSFIAEVFSNISVRDNDFYSKDTNEKKFKIANFEDKNLSIIKDGLFYGIDKLGTYVISNTYLKDAEEIYNTYYKSFFEEDVSESKQINCITILNFLQNESIKELKLDRVSKNFSRLEKEKYLFLLRSGLLQELEKKFNLNIRLLSPHEAKAFINFLFEIKNEQAESLKKFSIQFGINGLRTFLSLEHGGSDMGQKILDIGEKLPQETASKIFSKYAEIIDSVENLLNVVQNNFKSTIDTKPELLQSVEQSLYKRGADLLSQFHDNINQNPDEIIVELERINADTITTLSIFKYAAKLGNKLPLEDISGAEFSKKAGNELSPEDINEMEHIYQVNWKNYGNQQLIQSVIHKFKESLTGDNAVHEQVYTFKKNNQINAFVKFSDLQSGVKYASALNVDQSSKGFGLGETMMDEALYREAQENILIATCDPYNDSNMRYFEKGFVGTGFTGDNPPVMNICWNESMNTHITSKYISVDDLVMLYLKKQVPNNLIIKRGKTLQEVHTDIPVGKSLTRCFKDPLHTGDWYAVYESIPMDYETNIKTTG